MPFVPDEATPGFIPDTEPKKGILDTLTSFLVPKTKDFIQNLKTDIQAPQTIQEVGATALGPLGTTMFGSDRQKRAQGAAGEVLSYALPISPIEKTTSLGVKIAQAGFQGAKYGVINALAGDDKPSNPIDLAKDIQDKVAMSAGLSMAFPLAGEGIKQGKDLFTKAFFGTPKTIIRKIVKVSDKEAQDFQRAFSKQWDQEIIKRDGEKLKGKNFEQIIGYFQDKTKEIENKIGEILGKTGKTIKTQKLIDETEKIIAGLSPEAGNVGTSQTVSQLNTVLNDLKGNPEEISLVVANRIKRQLQDIAKYGQNAGVQDKPLRELASIVRELIETKAPGIKEQNMLSRLYSIAIEGAHTRSEQALIAKNQTVLEKLSQVIPFAAGAGVGSITRNPYTGIAVGTGAAAAGFVRQELQKPEYQTRILDALLQQRPDLLTRFGTKEKALEYLKKALIIGAQGI